MSALRGRNVKRMYSKMRKVEHGMLLDGKYVIDNALSGLLAHMKGLVAEKLHVELEYILNDFEDELAHCDISQDMTIEQIAERYK